MTKDFKSTATAVDKNLTIPGRTGHDHGYRKTVEQLPDYLKSNVNKKFLDGTLDQLVSNGSAIRANSYYGSKKGLVNNGVDLYYDANSTLKNQYQFDPAVTSDYKGIDEPKLHITYDDILNNMRRDVEEMDATSFDYNRFFQGENFTWRPPISENKFLNYNLYYWFEAGLPTIEIDGSFNPTTEIVGKAFYNYTSGTKNISFQNGMKIKFGSTISGAHTTFANKHFIVEGVGTEMFLIDLSITPWMGDYTFTASIDETERAYWDIIGGAVAPATYIDFSIDQHVANRKEYIVVRRGARDKSIWSRINQWYHIDTINDVLTFLGKEIDVTILEKRKAIRPIIEFERNIQLYTHGDFSRAPITYKCDTVQSPSAFVGTTSIVIDSITFLNDNTILFNNTSDLTFKNKIFTVGGVGTSVTLTLVTDSRDGTGTPSEGEVVLVTGRSPFTPATVGQGREYHFNSTTWVVAQRKLTTNQAPLFELWDDQNRKLSDASIFPKTTFAGNKIFSYVEGTRTDKELGFNTKYGVADTDNLLNKNYQNLVFNWDQGTERYVHGELPSQTKMIGYYYLYNYGFDEYDNGWKKGSLRLPVTKTVKVKDETSLSIDLEDVYGFSNDIHFLVTFDDGKFTWYEKEANKALTKIYPMHGDMADVFVVQTREYTIEFHHPTESLIIETEAGVNITTLTDGTFNFTPTNLGRIIYRNSTSSAKGNLYCAREGEQADHLPRVYYNGQATIHGLDWTLTENLTTNKKTIVEIALPDCPCEDPVEGRQIIRELKENDVIDIEWYTSTDSKERADVAHQLQSNPLNAEPTEISFHQVFDHFAEVLLNHRGYSGELSHPGIDSTSHQLIKQNVQGTIQQQNFPFVLNSLLYTDNNYNITNSIRYVADEWERYRNKFIKTAKNKVNTSVTGTLVRDIIDSTLAQLNVGKNVNFIFAHSHMAYYNSYEDSTYTADGILVDFDLGIEIDITDEYTNHVYVYVDNVLQIKNEDYTLANKTVTFITAPAATKTVLVRVINNVPAATPSYVPTSLQKNGLWQVYKPELTGSHILGHDGIKIPLTGIGDADSAIFELENRIYNNIASKHDVIHYDYYNIMPGAERATWATRTQWNAIQEDRFNSWAHENNVSISNTAFKNTDYTLGDPLTHNYSSLGIPGHIRGVFNWFYDTQDPVATPWEMLGYGQKPSFWDTQYDWRNTANGGNDAKRAALISALKFGMTGATGSLIHKVQLSRPGFITPIGVDGVLLNPVTTGLVTAPSAIDAQADFKFGDLSDVELTWWNDEKFQWAVFETLYKFRSNDLSHLKWNHTDTETINSELLDNVTRKRVRPEDMEVHLESIAGADPDDCRFTTIDKVLIQRSGINNLLIENVHNVNVTEPVDFIKYVEALNVRLAFKVEGYTDKNSTRLAVDTLGVTNEKFIPEEDFHVHFYRSAPLKQVSISGVRVIFNGTAFEVHGGDTILSSFLVTESNKGGPFDVVEVSNTSPTVTVSKYKNTTGNILKIPYGTEYTKVGDVYDFLINLGRYYESIGVMYKSYDTEGYHNWNRAASDFISWHAAFTSPLVAGDEVYLSPHNKELIFRDADKRFIDHAVSKVNEVFNIADKNGNRINNKYIDVNRLDNISHGDTPAARKYEFVITAIEENTELFFVRLNVIEYDHVITVNRYTVFADIVYDTLLNSRIWRAKFIGQKTGDWTGLPKGAGYIVTDTKLIPNFEKTINDIDRGYFSTEETVLNQALVDASRATLGYNTKAYLKDLLYNKDVAFEFWKGLIHKAGTPSVNTNIGRSADINNILTDVKVNEEWMFKLADAGSIEKNLVYEFQLKTDEVNLDPQIIEFPLDALATGITLDEVPYDEKITMSQSDPRWVHKPTDRIEFSTLTSDEYNATSIYWPGMPLLDETTNQTLYEKDLPTLFDSSKFELDSYNKFNNYTVGDIVRHEGKVFTAQTDIVGSVSNGTFGGIPLPVSQWTETAEPYRPIYWIAKKTIATSASSEFSGGQPMVFKAFDTNISIAQIGKGINTIDKAEITTVAAHNLTVNDYCIIVGTTTRPILDGIFKVDSLAVDSEGTLEDESKTVFYIDSYTDTNTLFGKVLPLMPVMFDTITELNATITDSRYAWKAGDIGYTLDTAYKFNGVSFDVERRSWIGAFKIDKVNPRALNNVNKVYNPKTKQQLAKFETYDPIKGVIPGIAEREIDTVGTLDTAVYTYSTDRSGNIDDRDYWERNEIGTTWWNTSTAVFIDYEQSTNSYKRNNWGKLFPGASIDVYEWIESPVEPGDWESKAGTTINGISITGTPFSIVNEEEETVYRYSTKQKYNSNTLQLETCYYFWVKGKTDVPNIISRNLSVKSIASYIENPSNLGLSWIAPIEKHAMIISNFGNTFEDKDAIFQIRFGEEQDVHSEFMLIAEGDDTEIIPEFFHGRMRDSLTTFAKTKETLSFSAWTAGVAYSTGSVVVNASIYYKATTSVVGTVTFDATKWSRLYDITDVNTTSSTLTVYRYNNVPDLSLHKLNQIGNRVRPAQSWYEDVTTARRTFIEKANMLLKEMNLIDSSIDWDKTIGTTITRGAISYNLADYWKHIDWESATYSSTTIPIKIVALRKNLSDEDLLLSVNIGDTVKVLEDGSGRWEIYQFVAEVPCTIAESWKLIAKQNATIELSCKLWDCYLDCSGWDICTWAGTIEWDKFPSYQLFQIIDALRKDIFIDVFKYAYGRLFFTMIDQALIDQPQLDWVHKTTYVQLKIDTNLSVKVNLYKPEVADYIVDYIKDVKPYHTKLRDVFNIKSHLETACITITDSDTKKIIIKFDRVGCGWDSFVQNPWDAHHDGNPAWDRGRSSWCDDWCKELIDGGDCPGITTPGWDNNCRGWDTISYDITDKSVLEDLFVDTIYNASTFGLDPATIELIIEGNKFIQPGETCYPEELIPVIPYDAVDIRVQTNTTGSTVDANTRTFQMFKDALNYFHIHRVDNTNGKTTIISAIDQLATEIEVVAGQAITDLTQPDVENNVPGVIWIGTERMEFWQTDVGTGGSGGDLLKGVTRGTLGTSAVAHANSSQVIDGGRRQQIPGIPDYWNYLDNLGTTPATLHVHTAFNDLGVTLQASTNAEANFINATTGTNW